MFKGLLLRAFSCIVRLCLRARYRFHLKNKHVLKQKKLKKGGFLILPNHPAEMDPIIMMVLLWNRFHLHPLVVEHFYYFPGAKPFMNAVGAIPIPNFENSVNQWKKDKGDKAFDQVIDGLKNGENFLIYPSGHLKRSPKEVVGGSSFIANVIQEYPDVNILMVRMSGLWGSSFSRAITGSVPHFWKTVLNGIWTVLKNGIFFAPKRDIEIEFFNPGEFFPYKGSKREINLYLQNFYNRYVDDQNRVVSEEPLKLISYSFYRNDLPGYIAALEQKSSFKVDVDLTNEEKDLIIKKISEVSEISLSDIDEEKDLSLDLGLDSLDIANLYVFITEQFEVSANIEPGELKLVHDLFVLAAGEKQSEKTDEESKFSTWKHLPNRPEPAIPVGKTIPEVFFNICKKMKNHDACSDHISGTLTYKKLFIAALIFAEKIKNVKGKYVGIMLPSSVGVYLTILACQIAGKIPVMLNWTAGIRSLKYAVDLLEIESIISSHKFLDRLDHLHLEELEQKLVFMEDIRKSISLKDKVVAALRSYQSTKGLLKTFKLNKVSETEPAVVLFTSGTEAYPKAVPLSHKNILTNQSTSVSVITVESSDILHGVLPPFHSFGFTVTGLMPLLAGMRAFYAPDPTDGHSMANDIERAGITMICLAPSFYMNLLRIATKEQLKSVRLFVSGAEKPPSELKKIIKEIDESNLFLEGYGITECSPVVTICDPENPIGVGKPLPNLELCVIHTETQEKLAQGQKGEICIHGPSVFYGYLGDVGRDPFIEIDGKKWYRSGDIGFVDDQNNLILEGRLKRFVKIGGEMVSLSAIEDELIQRSENKGWVSHEDAGKSFVLCAREQDSARPALILFTTCRVSKEEINSLIRDSGFARIVKVSEVRVLPEIPLLGTGKINYRKLNEMVKS